MDRAQHILLHPQSRSHAISLPCTARSIPRSSPSAGVCPLTSARHQKCGALSFWPPTWLYTPGGPAAAVHPALLVVVVVAFFRACPTTLLLIPRAHEERGCRSGSGFGWPRLVRPCPRLPGARVRGQARHRCPERRRAPVLPVIASTAKVFELLPRCRVPGRPPAREAMNVLDHKTYSFASGQSSRISAFPGRTLLGCQPTSLLLIALHMGDCCSTLCATRRCPVAGSISGHARAQC